MSSLRDHLLGQALPDHSAFAFAMVQEREGGSVDEVALGLREVDEFGRYTLEIKI